VKTANRPRRRLKARAGAEKQRVDYEIVVPVRWLKQVIAVFLAPVAWILTRAFFSSFSSATIDHAFWLSEEFWFFALGIVLWAIVFAGLPRPLLIYVFGHELTHAIWVWLLGGRVSRFNISRTGGYIVSDTSHFLVSLAPYFFPIYSVLVFLLYGSAGLFVDFEPYRRWFFAAVGFTWAFHVTFTIWMLWNGQTDLVEHGTFFSMMIIYLMNFIVLSAMLIVASREVSMTSFGQELLEGAIQFSDCLLRLGRQRA
jgi:hypothetical protein